MKCERDKEPMTEEPSFVCVVEEVYTDVAVYTRDELPPSTTPMATTTMKRKTLKVLLGVAKKKRKTLQLRSLSAFVGGCQSVT